MGAMVDEQESADLIIYGATPGGIAAACTVADRGMRVLLVSPDRHVGGHLTSGICTTECEHMLAVSFRGWMMKVLRLLGAMYGVDAPIHRFEPHRAMQAFRTVLNEAGVVLLTGAYLESVSVEAATIRAAVAQTDDGPVHLSAPLWIDASYEGDLMAMAGVSYAVGRESMATYHESLAGFRYIDSLDEVANSKGHAERIDHDWEIDLRRSSGGLIEGVIPERELSTIRGGGDGKVMNYHFRVTVTSAPDRVPFPVPDDYSEERYELLSRFLHAHPDTPLTMILAFLNHPSGRYSPAPDGFTNVQPGTKWELNNLQGSILSLGHLGGQFVYPDGDRKTRAAVIADHFSHNAGLLHFLSSSSNVPRPLREEMQRWGLPPDEYPDNGHWPYQPYIREARRMVGSYVMTQRDLLEERTKGDAIYWNSHWIDSHHVQRIARDDHHFRNEGRIWKELTEPYAVSYRALVPSPQQCSNLIVPGCVSSSHVAFCSIRLESSWMGLGEAAGEAAALAHERGCTVQDVPVNKLQRRLAIDPGDPAAGV